MLVVLKLKIFVLVYKIKDILKVWYEYGICVIWGFIEIELFMMELV